jgi:hypothetical protein
MYRHRLWKFNALLIETTHRTLTSLQIEVSVSRKRRERHEATRIEVYMGPLVGWKEVWHESELQEHSP